jgi:hypothetical protein
MTFFKVKKGPGADKTPGPLRRQQIGHAVDGVLIDSDIIEIYQRD